MKATTVIPTLPPIGGRVVVVVTADDFKHGRPGDCGACPVAMAVNRQFPIPPKMDVVWEWRVDSHHARLYEINDHDARRKAILTMTPAGTQLIRDIDYGRKIAGDRKVVMHRVEP